MLRSLTAVSLLLSLACDGPAPAADGGTDAGPNDPAPPALFESVEQTEADLKKVIDNNSGLKWSRKAGQVFDQIDKAGRQAAVETGKHTIVQPSQVPEVAKAWQPVIDTMIKNYISDLESKGLPAQEVYEKAVALVEECR